MQSPHRSPRRGFTLVELLTVIAIVAILATILIPAVGRVRHAAKTSECQSTLRHWGSLLQVYAQDNNFRMPNPWLPHQASEDLDENMPWTSSLVNNGYITKDETYNMMVCPNTDCIAGAGTVCYAMNKNLVTRWDQQYWYHNKLVNPTDTVMLGDVGINENWGVGGKGSGGTTLTHPDEASRPFDTLGFREANNTANILFADGHVEGLTVDEVTLKMFHPF